MISRNEVLELAREFQLAPNVVEKDYALGWLLAGITNHDELADSWVFKGGTCLKKCFFETYRFSEDLDFTLRDPTHLDASFLSRVFAEVTEWIYANAGLEMPNEASRFEIYTNTRGILRGRVVSATAGLSVAGAILRALSLILPQTKFWSSNPYLARSTIPIPTLRTAASKFYAMHSRKCLPKRFVRWRSDSGPRDLYDVIHLQRHRELDANHELVRTTLSRKCEYKSIPVPTFAFLANRPERQEIEAEWETMLVHQLPTCPPFELFWAELPGVFIWLEPGEVPPAVLPARIAPTGEQEDETWQLPAMATAWGFQAPLETVRFATANRLCVELGYQGSTRFIEPYSLRRTKDGALLLCGVRSDDGEIRAYRVDRIESAVAHRNFVPRFAVELTGAGQMVAPTVSSDERRARLGTRSTYIEPRRVGTHRTRASAVGQTRYIFECPVCHKRFTRTTHDATLNPHKNKQGWSCIGNVGVYRGTRH